MKESQNQYFAHTLGYQMFSTGLQVFAAQIASFRGCSNGRFLCWSSMKQSTFIGVLCPEEENELEELYCISGSRAATGGYEHIWCCQIAHILPFFWHKRSWKFGQIGVNAWLKMAPRGNHMKRIEIKKYKMHHSQELNASNILVSGCPCSTDTHILEQLW